MFAKIAETLVSMAVSAVALCIVGKVCYEAGEAMGAEKIKYAVLSQKCHQLEETTSSEKTEESMEIAISERPRKVGGLGLLSAIGRFGIHKRESALGKIVSSPQDYKIEAYIQGEELHVNAKPKEAVE